MTQAISQACAGNNADKDTETTTGTTPTGIAHPPAEAVTAFARITDQAAKTAATLNATHAHTDL